MIAALVAAIVCYVQVAKNKRKIKKDEREKFILERAFLAWLNQLLRTVCNSSDSGNRSIFGL